MNAYDTLYLGKCTSRPRSCVLVPLGPGPTAPVRVSWQWSVPVFAERAENHHLACSTESSMRALATQTTRIVENLDEWTCEEGDTVGDVKLLEDW